MKYLLKLFLIIPSLIYSQTKELDFEFFLYGLNHCYFEYDREFKDNQVDIFFESPAKEDLIAEYLKNIIEKDSINYAEIKRINRGTNFISDRGDNLSQYHIYSELIEKGLNKNFKDLTSLEQDLKSLLDIKKANSFITGAFLRNGFKINDTIYKIGIYVSSKPEYCYTILKNSNSTNVVFNKTYQDTIDNKRYNPTSTVYFNPSVKLKSLLTITDDIPNIKERFKMYLSEIYLDKISSAKNKKEIKEAKKEFTDFKLRFEKSFIEMNLEDIGIVEKLLKNQLK